MFLIKNAKKVPIAGASIFAATLFVHIFYTSHMLSQSGNVMYTNISKTEPNLPSVKRTTIQSNISWTDAGLLLPFEQKKHDEQWSSSSGLSTVFSKHCYRYHSFIASNTCCDLFDYHRNPTKIEECIKLRSEINTRIKNETKSSIFQVKTTQQHWVFIGDSHCRYIFVSLIYIFEKHKLRYRFPQRKTLKTLWQDFDMYRKDLKALNFHEDLEILHKEIPLKISFLWDKKLYRLPGLAQEWHTLQEGKPTFVLADTGLFYMADRAQDEFENFMRILPKNISSLAATVPIVYKLIDHLQAKDLWFSQQMIDEYNAFASRVLRNTDVIVWNSCLPLSDMYVQECRRHPRNMKKSRHWLCMNKGHTGYIMVDQYANMVLNYVCSKTLYHTNYCA